MRIYRQLLPAEVPAVLAPGPLWTLKPHLRSTEFLSYIKLAEERVVQTLSDPTKTMLVGDGQGLWVRWFDDGLIVLVEAWLPRGLEPPYYLFNVLRLTEQLPAGRIARSMSMEEVLRVVAHSFGLPFCSPLGSAIDIYHGQNNPVILDSLRPYVDRDDVMRWGFLDDRTCKHVFVISLKRYFDWLNAPVTEILNLPTIRTWTPARGAKGRKRVERTIATADILTSLCDELTALINVPDVAEETLHQWLNHPQHHVFLDAYANQVRSKVPFGDKVSDFVVRRSDDTYLLIEIEPPRLRIFRAADAEPSAPFNHAIQQLRDWQRYIRENMRTVRAELDLPDIYEPAGLLIAGRKEHIDSGPARQRWIDLKGTCGCTLLTYDELCDRVRVMTERLRQVVGF